MFPLSDILTDKHYNRKKSLVYIILANLYLNHN
jgi:hypothetical protein